MATDSVLTLQQLEYIETGFEVSRNLAQAGFNMEAPALTLTWGQVAETLAHTLVDYGLTPDRLEEETLPDLARLVQQSLHDGVTLNWQDIIRMQVTAHPGINTLLEFSDMEDDEGPLTEQYENATRLGDDEGCWTDCSASAGCFDDF
ncbi:MAG: hypothetical protein CVU39_07675 [Chloroflexi bacterium HGW-Chloroflexi-10]|nr:MAG: hypothetical protein CVU39_07675 [Chloroflexi bacterium HGW-Chloroflexi-10]